ncbi:MAG: hypothetical protein KDA91_10255 [Planctomycetaceae bacterium]|nr:hypothetical protein [Planctomycetaceae bacterium]
MSRRKSSDEHEVGSDSFLDVIANIVGILIILIVIVGMKVARQEAMPVSDADVAEFSELQSEVSPAVVPDSQLTATESETSDEVAKIKQALKDAELMLSSERKARQILVAELEHKRAEVSAEAAAIASLNGDLDLLRLRAASHLQQGEDAADRLASLTQEVTKRQSDVDRLKKQVSDAEEQVATVCVSITKAEEQVDAFTKAIEAINAEMLELEEVISPEENAAVPPTDRLQHRLSPVGKVADSSEIHFRVINNQISFLPVDELLDRLKSQLNSRMGVIARMPQYGGTVGPVHGYVMNYTVERHTGSLPQGNGWVGGTMLAVSGWTIEADDQRVPSESTETALRPGSQFRRMIESQPIDSAITLWVYPDSFQSFAALREVAHGLQLRVAARPLPAGTPISGSSKGSRSIVQ